MSRKNLQHITLNSDKNQAINQSDETNFSSEDHAINSNDSETDFEFGAGLAPFLRGISSTMYITSPWDIHQSANYNSAEDYNGFYKRNFEAGQRHFSLGFKENETFCIETLDQFKSIFNGVPLNEISISLADNTSSLAILAFYSATAEAQGIDPKTLKGTFSLNILKYLNNQNTIYNSEKSISEIIRFSTLHLPFFNTISISSKSLQVLNPETELALMLIYANNQLKKGIDSGLKIDDIAPRLSFNFENGTQHFITVSKLRAARLLWAKIVKTHQPKNEQSLALHIYSKTSSSYYNNSENENAITKATIQGLAFVFGGTQSLDTQTVVPSTLKSERLDKKIQLFLQTETQITKTVDPWAGSFYVEKTTHDLAQKAWSIFESYDTSGTLPQAIQSELNQIEIDTLDIENAIQSSTSLPNNRDQFAVSHSLLKLTEATKKGDKNLLTLAIEAVKSHATFSEICKAVN